MSAEAIENLEQMEVEHTKSFTDSRTTSTSIYKNPEFENYQTNSQTKELTSQTQAGASEANRRISKRVIGKRRGDGSLYDDSTIVNPIFCLILNFRFRHPRHLRIHS